MSNMTEKTSATNADKISFEQETPNKTGAFATATALGGDNDTRIADENAYRKPDRNLTAAIWTIVCGVALPCIPVIVVSAILLWLVLHNRVEPKLGLPELRPPVDHDRCTGFIGCFSYARHYAGAAYFVDYNPSTITTIASWTSRVIPYLTSSVMALVAFFAARRIVIKSKKGSGDALPSPEQLTLLIGLLGGSGFEPLKDTLFHRWVHKTKLVDPIPLAFSALLIITLLGLTIPLVDTWFGISTVPASITQIYTLKEYLGHELVRPDMDTYVTELTSTVPAFMSTRSLNSTLCANGPGGFTAMSGTEWMACNIDFDDGGGDYDMWLQGSSEATQVLQGYDLSSTNVSSFPADYTAGDVLDVWDEPGLYYLDNKATFSGLDYKAATFAMATQCTPITSQCLQGSLWPDALRMNFSCSPGFSANFSFSGVSQAIDSNDEWSGYNAWPGSPSVGLAFSRNALLSTRVGALDPRLFSYVGTAKSIHGNTSGYEFLYPQNPIHFAAWASGYPSMSGEQLTAGGPMNNTLFSDRQIYRIGQMAAWVLNCSATIYDVTYTVVNGSVREFNKSLASPELGGFISAPLALPTSNDLRSSALTTMAATAGAMADSRTLATMFADHFSTTALSLSAGALEAKANLLSQVREVKGPLARVPIIPLYTLLLLKAIYVLAVILLAIGAYCFTHPAETEIVKTQLSTKGLAAAHFDTPDILQSKVVSQLSERLQPAAKDPQAEVPIDPARGGLRRAVTLAEMPNKRVGIAARADGAWKFVVVANGVYNMIEPIAVDVVGMQAKAGNLGEAGDLVKAWMK